MSLHRMKGFIDPITLGILLSLAGTTAVFTYETSDDSAQTDAEVQHTELVTEGLVADHDN